MAPFNLDFSKLEFKVNWASGVTLVTLLTIVVGLYITNKGLQNKVDSVQNQNKQLSGTVDALTGTVNTLKGSQEITNKAIDIFMQNSPAELKYRIGKIEERLNLSPNKEDKQFENIAPPKIN